MSHLPSRENTTRMRLWRGLRALGAVLLRDGVYLVPREGRLREAMREHADSVRAAGGSAHVLACETDVEEDETQFRALFDRSKEYASWHRGAAELLARLSTSSEAQARRSETTLRRTLDDITRTDFFPGASHEAAHAAMAEVASAVNGQFSPDEPSPRGGDVTAADRAEYQGCTWATRHGLWVDRVASAWLIRRFIDHESSFVWLESPADCPGDAIGFDYDGAQFSHIGDRVTFEVLLEAFALIDDGALVRLGALVHYLDVGGAPIAEAPGVLALLGAARERCKDDDAFLSAATTLFDDLHAAFAVSGKASE